MIAGTADQSASLGEEIVRRINELGAISEDAEGLTRIYLTRELRAAADLIMGWMREAGMSAHLDAIGNVCGRYEGERPGAPCLMLGSHYDTVRDAGKWDGPLGVITAISCIADLHRRGKRLPFAIEIVGFADEEGVRFASTLLGSRAVAGTFDESVLNARDRDGISMREALVAFGLDPDHIGAAARARRELLAYLELHIEQGPVLEAQNLPVGVVTLAERHDGKHVTRESFGRMVDEVAAMVEPFAHRKAIQAQIEHLHMLGTSGTVTTLAGVHLGLPKYDRRRVDGAWLAADEVDVILDQLLAMTYDDRIAHPCIGAERADLVLAGCAILEGMRRHFPCQRLRVADRGLREGILVSLMRQDGVWRRPFHHREQDRPAGSGGAR